MVLAIDPGPQFSAYALWDGEQLHEFGKIPNAEVLTYIDQSRSLKGLDRLVVEMIGHYGKGMPAGKDVFDTCIWIGRFFQEWPGAKYRVLRATVKTHICGSAKAKDGNVRQAVIDRLGAPGTKRQPGATYGVSKDVWQALALALTFHDRMSRGWPEGIEEVA
jgi:hypothetical protein